MLVLVNILWVAAAFALLHMSKGLKDTGCGPYVECPRCHLWHQACEATCPSCCMNGRALRRPTTILPWDMPLAEDDPEYDNVLIEHGRVNESKKNSEILRDLVMARFFVVMAFLGILGLCLQKNCEGFEAYDGSNVGARYNTLVPVIGWFLYEIAACFYLLGDGSATRQGPGALASIAVRRRAWLSDIANPWIQTGRRQTTKTSILVYAAAGIVDLALAAVWLYLGIFPSHPAVDSLGQSGVAMRILGLVIGMYVLDITTLLIASRVGFIVEEPRACIPEGGWEERHRA